MYGYKRAAEINIGSSADGELENYQIELQIFRGTGTNHDNVIYLGSRADNWPYDIRFTSSDGETLLDFWREEYDEDGGIWWVEVPLIPASGGVKIYCFCGNPGGTDVSNGDATFRFGDDFEDSSVDTTKWTVTGNVAEDSGRISVYKTTTSGDGTASLVSKRTFARPARVIMAVYATPDGSTSDMAWRGGLISGTNRVGINGAQSSVRQFTTRGTNTLNQPRSTDFSTIHRYRLEWRYGKVEHFVDGELEASTTDNQYIPSEALPIDYLVYYGSGPGQYIFIYYVWVLAHTANPPTVSTATTRARSTVFWW